MEIYKRLLTYMRPYWLRLAIAMICMAGVGAMTGASALVVKNVLDDIFIEKDQFMLKLIPVLVIVIFFVKGVFFYFQGYLMAYVGQRTVRDLRDELYAHIQRQSLAFFGRNPTGTLMSRITYDVNLVSASVSGALSSLLRESFSMISLIGVIFYTDWQLAVIALFFYPLAIYPILRLGRRLRRIFSKSQEAMGSITSFLQETITGTRIVKAFGMENYETRRFNEANRGFFKLVMKTERVRALTRPLMEILSSCTIAAIIFYGGSKVMKGTLTTGEFFSFMTALLMLYKPAKQLSNVNNVIQEGVAAAIRIFDILDTVPDIRDRDEAVKAKAFEKEIEFKKVTFRYGEKDVLRNLDLTVRKGERLAIVGSSGAGKSTLINLVARFYDVTEGAIEVDGIDVKDLTVESLRSLIGIVTQETILFNDTVRSNIAYGKEETSEEEIIKAAKAAFAHEFIEQLPEGYDTIIGEQGTRLSGGQRQRLSIARAILKNAPILILDEATSALDTESEKLVQEALNNLMKDRTSFVIAHRLSTIQDADRIVVLSKGKLIEEGTHSDLVSQKGQYAKFCSSQFKPAASSQ